MRQRAAVFLIIMYSWQSLVLKVFFVDIPWGVFDSADATSFAFFNIAEYNFKFRFEIIFILSCVHDIILFFLSPSVTQ